MLVTKPLPNILAFTRASKAWDVDASGALTEFAVDAIRRGYDPATLQPVGWNLEGASANAVRNPRAESAVPGIPGTAPQFWSTGSVAGLTREILGVFTVNGISVLRVRFSGTATAGGPCSVAYETAGAVNGLTAGTLVTQSLYCALVAGSFPNIAQHWGQVVDNGNAIVQDLQPALSPSLSAALTRYSRTQTVPATGTAPYKLGGASVLFYVTSGNTYDFTVDVGGGQVEQNYLASSLIFPPAGAPAAASRANDALVCTGSAFAAIFGAAKEGWVVAEAMLDHATAGNLGQWLFEVDDGTDNNRVVAATGSGGSGNLVRALYTVAGTGNNTVDAGTLTANVPFRTGIRWTPAGLACSFNGGALASAAVALPAGFTALRLGNSASNTRPLNGRVRGVWGGGNGGVSDAAFRAACTLGTDPDALLRS